MNPFEFNPSVIGGELDPFPLIASTKSPASRRPIMGDRETKLYRKLPPFLADSLPDAWGNQVFECWRIQNGIRNQEITPLEILSFIGKWKISRIRSAGNCKKCPLKKRSFQRTLCVC